MNDTTPAPVASRADVTTDQPARYAKQLVSHLGRKLDFIADGFVSTAAVGAGNNQAAVGDGVLKLLASGPDQASLAAVEHVLRFATREDHTVAWTRTTGQARRCDPVRAAPARPGPHGHLRANGALTALKVARLDLVGILTRAMITALDGGIIRTSCWERPRPRPSPG